MGAGKRPAVLPLGTGECLSLVLQGLLLRAAQSREPGTGSSPCVSRFLLGLVPESCCFMAFAWQGCVEALGLH